LDVPTAKLLDRIEMQLEGRVQRHPAGLHYNNARVSLPEVGGWERRGIDELARVLHDEHRAKLVAMQAGFPAAMMPPFRDPQDFWERVAIEARNGALHGGLRPIFLRASRQYPANPIFARVALLGVS
jgi:Effector-associated domain 1